MKQGRTQTGYFASLNMTIVSFWTNEMNAATREANKNPDK